jgi:hypothetical protein
MDRRDAGLVRRRNGAHGGHRGLCPREVLIPERPTPIPTHLALSARRGLDRRRHA